MNSITYLFYILIYEGLIWGLFGYAVFSMGASGWWFLLAVLASSGAYSPEKWAALQ